MRFDIGATTQAADRLDFPEQVSRESEGSRTGQTFGCAGGKKLANEGEVHVVIVAPGGIECEIEDGADHEDHAPAAFGHANGEERRHLGLLQA